MNCASSTGAICVSCVRAPSAPSLIAASAEFAKGSAAAAARAMKSTSLRNISTIPSFGRAWMLIFAGPVQEGHQSASQMNGG